MILTHSPRFIHGGSGNINRFHGMLSKLNGVSSEFYGPTNLKWPYRPRYTNRNTGDAQRSCSETLRARAMLDCLQIFSTSLSLLTPVPLVRRAHARLWFGVVWTINRVSRSSTIVSKFITCVQNGESRSECSIFNK